MILIDWKKQYYFIKLAIGLTCKQSYMLPIMSIAFWWMSLYCVVMLSVVMQSVVMQSVVTLGVVMLILHCAECRYAECHYAERHYAESHYAECHCADSSLCLVLLCWVSVSFCGVLLTTTSHSPGLDVAREVSEGTLDFNKVTIIPRKNFIFFNYDNTKDKTSF